jgi:hypothetical protein
LAENGELLIPPIVFFIVLAHNLIYVRSVFISPLSLPLADFINVFGIPLSGGFLLGFGSGHKIYILLIDTFKWFLLNNRGHAKYRPDASLGGGGFNFDNRSKKLLVMVRFLRSCRLIGVRS